MKKILTLLFPLSLLIIGQGCTESSPLISDEELAVVWGFVYAGEPVNDIKITGTLPLDADSSDVSPPINDADVAVVVDGDRFECELAAGDAGYYQYLGDDLNIKTGDKVSIEVDWQGQKITGESTVPEPPTGIGLNSNVMVIPDFNDRESFRAWRESEDRDIVVSWDNLSDDDWFYVTLECIEVYPQPIDMTAKFSELKKSFVFPPIQDTTYNIGLLLLEFKGWHEITVYRVNREYVDLYESREQDSRDLNEPLSNIEGGLGVFSAFNSTKVRVKIVQN